MDNFEEAIHTTNIKSALKLCSAIKAIKAFLAVLIAVSYLWFPNILIEIIVVAMIVVLLTPLGFFDVFIQKLLEYNTRVLETRQLKNAEEANKQFDRVFQKIDRL